MTTGDLRYTAQQKLVLWRIQRAIDQYLKVSDDRGDVGKSLFNATMVIQFALGKK